MSFRFRRPVVLSIAALVALVSASAPAGAQDPTTTTTTSTTTTVPTTTTTTAPTTTTTAPTTTTKAPTTTSSSTTTSSTSSTTSSSTTSTTKPNQCPEGRSTTTTTTGDDDTGDSGSDHSHLDKNCDGIIDADERTDDVVDDLLDDAPEDDPYAPVDAPGEDVPLDADFEIPEAVDGKAAAQVIMREITVARADAVRARERVGAAKATVDALNAELAAIQTEIGKLDAEQQATVARLAAAKLTFEERVAAALVRGQSSELEMILDADSALDISRRQIYLESISDADLAAVVEYVQARDTLDRGIVVAIDNVAAVRRDLREANTELRMALEEDAEKKFQLAVFAAGSEIVIEDFVFPVGQPASFIDSWGYPRMTGSEYEHTHKGTDIMAPFGTPLYAVERGVITRMGTDILGGIKLWVKGASGTYYYYAHLQGYADGMAEGTVVEAGDIVGYVGDTGNAKGGPPHLHFQVHPRGGEAVNPYGLLRVVADLSDR